MAASTTAGGWAPPRSSRRRRPRVTPPVPLRALADALWLTGDARAALDVLGSTTTDLAPGVAAAAAARAGSAPAATIAQRAQLGLDGDTAFERCCAVAALIACDEPDAACRALAAQAARATANGARAELNMIASLWARMVAVARATPEPTQLLPGPDPGPSPWEAWLDDPAAVERFAAPSARAAAHRSAAGDASGEARIELLELGVAALRHSPRRAVLAQALAELGRALRHLGRRAAARSTLREALDISQRLGLGRVAAQATEELRVAGARPRRERLSGPESLTAAERRVAEVAALGLTNRDIAAQLFLCRRRWRCIWGGSTASSTSRRESSWSRFWPTRAYPPRRERPRYRQAATTGERSGEGIEPSNPGAARACRF